MLTPNNQEWTCGVDESLTFLGFTLGPGQVVTIEVAEDPAGPWTTLTTATSSLTPVNYAGVNLYGWSVSTVVDTWATGPAGFESYLRADVGGFDLITFDHASVTGLPPGVCVNNQVSAGTSLPDAVAACSSSASPVVTLLAPFGSSCACTPGLTTNADVVIETPGDLALNRCWETIDGDLEIRTADFPVVDLPQLAQVTGDVSVDYQWSGGNPVVSARQIEVDALTNVGGSLSLSWDDASMVDPNLDFRMPNLTTVDGDLTVDVVNVNYNLTGLPALTDVDGTVSLLGSTGDIYAPDFTPALDHIGGDLIIEPGYAMRRVFEGVQTVDGSVAITGGFIDTGNDGLDLLTTIGGDLRFDGVQWAPINEAFPALVTIGGELSMVGNDLPQLSVITTNAVDVGGVTLDANPDLTQLDATLTVDVAAPITITNNATLDTCEADTFVADQTALGWAGTSTISGNSGPGC